MKSRSLDKQKFKQAELEKQKKEIFWRRFWYTIEELAVLLFTILGVITADAFDLMKHGTNPVIGDIWKGWLNMFLSCIAAVMVYGMLYSKLKYNDRTKPPIFKRMATAFFIGTAWKTYIGIVE